MPEYQHHVANRALAAARKILTAPILRRLERDRQPNDPAHIEFDIDSARPERVTQLWTEAGIDSEEWGKMRRSVEAATKMRLWPKRVIPIKATAKGELLEVARVYQALEMADRFNVVEWRRRPAIGIAAMLIVAGFLLQLAGIVGAAA